jgi:hypothetical protein
MLHSVAKIGACVVKSNADSRGQFGSLHPKRGTGSKYRHNHDATHGYETCFTNDSGVRKLAHVQ